jgi:hypothetical protein
MITKGCCMFAAFCSIQISVNMGQQLLNIVSFKFMNVNCNYFYMSMENFSLTVLICRMPHLLDVFSCPY